MLAWAAFNGPEREKSHRKEALARTTRPTEKKRARPKYNETDRERRRDLILV